MKINVKKSFLSAALIAGILSICLNVNAAPVPLKSANTIAVSDTGKMDKMSKSKMSKSKMSKDKMSSDKMSKSKMSKDKMSKGKMAKDSSKM